MSINIDECRRNVAISGGMRVGFYRPGNSTFSGSAECYRRLVEERLLHDQLKGCYCCGRSGSTYVCMYASLKRLI